MFTIVLFPTMIDLNKKWNQATPKLSEDKVKQCVDARLNGEYPPKAVAKVTSF